MYYVLKYDTASGRGIHPDLVQPQRIALAEENVIAETSVHMNQVQEVKRINERELAERIPAHASWHAEYKDSAWVFVGNLSIELTEGDVICVMSQWGEIEDINLVRDKDTGKFKGFGFVKYEDQRSTILAVDNFNGAELLERTMRVDHVKRYRLPQHLREKEEQLAAEAEGAGAPARRAGAAGLAYEGETLANRHDLKRGVDLFSGRADQLLPGETEEEAERRAKRARREHRKAGGGIQKELRKARKKDAKKAKKAQKKAKRKAKKAAKKAARKERKRSSAAAAAAGSGREADDAESTSTSGSDSDSDSD